MTSSNSQQALRAAAGYLLKPIARIMIRGGVNWKEFAEIAKGAFVQAASEDYGIDGRQTNASRVALLTGLSRREVARVRGLTQTSKSETGPDLREGPIPRLLAGWHQDPDFLDASEKPRALPNNAEAGGFRDLLKRYAGDIPPVAFTKELARLGLIEDHGGMLVVRSRNFTPSHSDPDMLRQAGLALHDHASTIAHNLNSERKEGPRFERLVSNLSVSQKTADQFHALLQQEGQKFLEKLDAWLTKKEQAQGRRPGQPARAVRVGAGIYYLQD